MYGSAARSCRATWKRVPSVDSLIPALYLKGVSTEDFSKALQAILGTEAPGAEREQRCV